MSPLAEPALIMLISAGACVAVGRLAIPVLIRAQRVAPARYEDCPPLLAYQERKQGTPTLGGLFVLFVGIAVALAAGGLSHQDGWIVLGAVLAMGVVGLVDDGLKFRGVNARGLRMKPKLLMTFAVGAVVGLFSQSSRLPVGTASSLGWLWVPFAMVVLAGCAHAVNLTDGMDGLAAGCVAIALAVLGLLAVQATGSRALVVWCASLSGACLGFLWFNSFPAQVFLGDVGALGFGAALGTLGLLTRHALCLLIIGGIFVAEALSVMLQVASYKWRGRRRIFRVAPIHHHFHLGGISEPKLIVRFWIVGAMLGLLSLTRIARP